MHRNLESCAHDGMSFYDLEIQIFLQISKLDSSLAKKMFDFTGRGRDGIELILEFSKKSQVREEVEVLSASEMPMDFP